MIITEYMRAFERKDLSALRSMFCDDVTLQDPFVGKIEGIERVLDICKGIFDGNVLKTELRRLFKSEAGHFAQEFSLVVTDSEGKRTLVEGVDCFELAGNKIKSLRAYVEAKPVA
jgi:ketosteroid isomerase-like protein